MVLLASFSLKKCRVTMFPLKIEVEGELQQFLKRTRIKVT